MVGPGRLLRVLLFVLGLVPAGSVACPGGGAADPDSRLSGIVLDAAGKPIPGARVQAQLELESGDFETIAESRADVRGRFQVGPLPVLPPRVFARASAEGLASVREGSFPGGSLTLRLVPGGTLRGRVLADATGEALAGSQVTVQAGDHWMECVRTGSDGRWEVQGVPAGRLFVRVDPAHGEEVVLQDVPLKVGEKKDLDLWVQEATVLAGVLRARDGRPIPGALVQDGWRIATSDDRGRYRLEAGRSAFTHPWEANRRSIEVRAAGFAEASVEVILPPGLPEFRRDFTLEPAPTTMRGRVLQGAKPVSGARVSFDARALLSLADGAFAATREDGRFTLDSWGSGDRFVFARTPDGALGFCRFSASEGGGSPEVTLEVVPSALLEGRVFDMERNALPGAEVRVLEAADWPHAKPVVGWLTSVACDSVGRFRLRLPQGKAVLQAVRERVKSGPVAVHSLPPRADRKSVDLVIPGPGHGTAAGGQELVGTVMDPSGVPIPGVSICSFMELGTTAADGAFRILGANQELQVLIFSHPDYAHCCLFHVRPEEGPLHVVLRKGLRIRGRVSVAPGTAATRAFRVLARREPDEREEGAPDRWMQVSDGDGRFEIGNLVAGKYTVFAHAGNRVSAPVGGVAVDAAAPAREVSLLLRQAGSVAGTVRDPEGRPIPGIDVWWRRKEPASDSDWIDGPATTTDQEGRYLLTGLFAGPASVSVPEDEEFLESRRGVSIDWGKESMADLVRPRGGSVRVTVVDENGAPVRFAFVVFEGPGGARHPSRTERLARVRRIREPGADVRANAAFEEEHTREDGTLLREELPPGACIVKASTTDAERPRLAADAEVEVLDGKTVEIRLVLKAARKAKDE
jgi:protocatechuate 3,4-dioxygenase beta subunit